MKYVIIGNGFAGVWACESIRKIDDKNEIVLISDERNYSRPLISYILGKKVNSTAMPFRTDEFFESLNIVLKIGKIAKSIDNQRKIVKMEDGEEISYDKLLIATGGAPIFPPINGSTNLGVYNFTKYRDYEQIAKYIEEQHVKQVVVLGGGLIGLKATEALMEIGMEVKVIELADRILSATFDKSASKIIENALQKNNCEVITQDTIETIMAIDGKVDGVILKSHRKIECQMVIIAIGVKPDLSLAKSAGLNVNRGVVADEFLTTSDPNIYVAGDVAEHDGKVIAILPIAARQGKVAGYNMTQQDPMQKIACPSGLVMNSVSLAGIPTISVGLTNPSNPEKYEILEKLDSKRNTYRKIILEHDVIVGVILINDVDRGGIYTGLIKDEMKVSEFKDELIKDTFGLISLPKNYRKHKVQGPGMLI